MATKTNRTAADIGREVRKLRLALGVSQEQIAARLGVSFSTVNAWENGRRRPLPHLARRLAEWAQAADLPHTASRLRGEYETHEEREVRRGNVAETPQPIGSGAGPFDRVRSELTGLGYGPVRPVARVDEHVICVAEVDRVAHALIVLLGTPSQHQGRSFETEAHTAAWTSLAAISDASSITVAWVTDGSADLFLDLVEDSPLPSLPAATALGTRNANEARERARLTKAIAPLYAALSDLRELLYSKGRLGSRGESLDELAKLLFLKMQEELTYTNRLKRENLTKIAAQRLGDATHLAAALRLIFREVAADPRYCNPDGSSIFGAAPELGLHETEDDFASSLVQVLDSFRLIDFESDMNERRRRLHLDVVNEVFGHFLRDSFINERQLGQYLTPIEVVNAMVDMAITEVLADEGLSGGSKDGEFVVLDPACGVGSFLVAAVRRLRRLFAGDAYPQRNARSRIHLRAVGLDKSDRMVRLAQLNAVLFGNGAFSILQANSITTPIDRPPLASLSGKVSLVLTNPPFGAEFTGSDLVAFDLGHVQEDKRFPVETKVNSELLFVERALELLRPGGRLLMIVPDSVLTNVGKESGVRKWIEARADVRAVISLPAVTFEQTGTGTKTSILYVQKFHAQKKRGSRPVFLGICEDLGFEVRTRGSQRVKVYRGVNKLLNLVDVYKRTRGKAHDTCREGDWLLEGDVRATWRTSLVASGRWDAGYFDPRLLGIQRALESHEGGWVEIREVAEPSEEKADPGKWPDRPFKYIEISDVDGETGTITPKTLLGREAPSRARRLVRSGDVLVSTVRPNRNVIAVVPAELDGAVCSTGFAVLKAKKVPAEYLFACLKTPLTVAQLTRRNAGIAYPAVSEEDVLQVRIPRPSGKLQKEVSERIRKAADLRAKARRMEEDAIASVKTLASYPVGTGVDDPSSRSSARVGKR